MSPEVSDVANPVKISDHPNPWSVLSDATKTLITLATGFLGLTVTFAQDFIDDVGRGWVALGWVCLLGSIVANIYTIGGIQAKVRTTEKAAKYGDRTVLTFFNISFILLAMGGLLIAVGAWLAWIEPTSPTLSEVVEQSRAAASELTSRGAGGMSVLSVVHTQDGGFEVVLATERDSTSINVTLDSALDVLSARRTP